MTPSAARSYNVSQATLEACMTVHTDEAFEFLVERLAVIPEHKGRFASNARSGTYGCDISIPQIAVAYWQPRDSTFDPSNLQEEQCQPFYDAAWDLCRIGVIRPGEPAPRGISKAQCFGEGYTITAFGRVWLQDAKNRPAIDPSRLSGVFLAFQDKFGQGYSQRATEAVRTYRTNNYLAACVMAGAAAESVLLAVAIAKDGESQVLRDYKTSSGRRRVTARVVSGVSGGIAAQFQAALQVLHHWRDDAGHGTMTTISEIEAFASLTQLLKLAQFASDHWEQLTDRNGGTEG
jgi:hypothetical protein